VRCQCWSWGGGCWGWCRLTLMFIVAWWSEGVARERWEVLVLRGQTRVEVEVGDFEKDDQSIDWSSKQTIED
jgi:hypothetical protein